MSAQRDTATNQRKIGDVKLMTWKQAEFLGIPYEYCGWRTKELRQSPLANPYRANPNTPGATLSEYRKWLWERLQDERSNQATMIRRLASELLDGKTITLCCWCKCTDKCHTSVIKDCLRWYLKEVIAGRKGLNDPKPLPRRAFPTQAVGA